jgi:DNA-binding MarR family transcriptional regulator
MYANEFGKWIHKFSKDYKCKLESELAPSLTEGQLNVLEIIDTQINMQHEMKPSDLIHYLDTTAAAVTTLLDRMEKNSLIKRKRDQHDRRVVWIHITEHGKAEILRGRSIRENLLTSYLNRLSWHNQQFFIYLCGKVFHCDDHKVQGN